MVEVNLAETMDEIGERLEEIETLRTKPWGPVKSAQALPLAIVHLPETIDPDQTYGRGMDSMEISVTIVVGYNSDRIARDQLSAFCSGVGDKSVILKLRNTVWHTCHTVSVGRIRFGTMKINGKDLIGAAFTLNVTGSGR